MRTNRASAVAAVEAAFRGARVFVSFDSHRRRRAVRQEGRPASQSARSRLTSSGAFLLDPVAAAVEEVGGDQAR